MLKKNPKWVSTLFGYEFFQVQHKKTTHISIFLYIFTLFCSIFFLTE